MDSALVIFGLTYIVIAAGQPPLFRIDRTGAAIIGASLMLVAGVLPLDEAYRAIDYNTIVILFGMMVVVANLRFSGFFPLVSSFVIARVHSPRALLYAVIAISGVLSALFVNDTVCLVLTPVMLAITGRLGLNPVPFLLGLCMAANIGSAATITGNPQNIMIGSFSGIPYARFTLKMLPVASFGLLACAVVLSVIYRRDLRNRVLSPAPFRVRPLRPLLIKSLAVSLVMMVLFFAGAPMAVVSVGAAAFLLITRRVKPERVYAAIDWRILILFIGLFIVVRGVEHSGAAVAILNEIGERTVGHPFFLTAASAFVSNLVSNVPAVLLFQPLIAQIPDPEQAWLLLSMSSTLAGNLTILGSIANLIVLESAKSRVRIGIVEYMRAGIPVTILSVGFGVFWLVL